MIKILRLITLIFIALLLMLQGVQAQIKQAEQGVLDLSEYDAPLSYIDRYPKTFDTQEKQQQNYKILNQYVQQQKYEQQKRKQQALKELDTAINDVTKAKQHFDESRASYNYNYYDPYYTDKGSYSTEIRRDPYFYHEYYNPYYHDYNHSDSSYPYNGNYYGYLPYMNIFNIPGYIGNTESHYDGYDNDKDDFIDEGFSRGNIQIILRDSGVSKDDEWALYVDGKNMGLNRYGMIRTWDLSLYPGTHEIAIVGARIPDSHGTYSIVFRNANVVSGPPLVGQNIQQGQTLKWIIQVR